MKSYLLLISLFLFSGFSVIREMRTDPPGMIAVMKQMETEARILKKYIEQKSDLPSFIDSIPDMRHSKPSDPDEITPGYLIMAEENLRLRKQIFNAKNPRNAFNRYITSCVSCHNQHCPGPVPRILKLKID